MALILWSEESGVLFEIEKENTYDIDEKPDIYASSASKAAIVLIITLLIAVIVQIIPHLIKKSNFDESVAVDKRADY